MKKSKKSSKSLPSPTSFSSLPYDIALNILARISRTHHHSLSLVSKGFQSLITSRELDETRSRIGKTEDCLYVCLNLHNKNHNPRWFSLGPISERQKLLQLPLCTYKYPYGSPTVASIGSEIYIIGGFLRGKSCRTVLVLNCQSHQWIRLPQMRVARNRPAAEVVDGKIYVIGGCRSNKSKDWGEVYDPKTRSWEPVLPTNLTTQMSVVPGRLVMGGKVYLMNGLQLNSTNNCLVEIETNMFCQISISVYDGVLTWCDENKELGWRKVTGLEGLYATSYTLEHFFSVSCGGRRVTVWSEKEEFRGEGGHYTKERKSEIWCTEISFERRGVEELRGVLEWSKYVSTFDGRVYDFFLGSAMITH